MPHSILSIHLLYRLIGNLYKYKRNDIVQQNKQPNKKKEKISRIKYNKKPIAEINVSRYGIEKAFGTHFYENHTRLIHW